MVTDVFLGIYGLLLVYLMLLADNEYNKGKGAGWLGKAGHHFHLHTAHGYKKPASHKASTKPAHHSPRHADTHTPPNDRKELQPTPNATPDTYPIEIDWSKWSLTANADCLDTQNGTILLTLTRT